MRLVNDDLLACTPEGRFVTASVGIWNQQDRSWTYCAAGHPGGMLLTASHVESLESTVPLLGVLSDSDWATKIMRLSVGERVFLYTDGVVESGLVDGRVATNYDLQNVLKDSADLDLTEQVAAIIAGTARRDRGRVTDDATIIAFEVLSESAS
jgi:serine phosphatase RsbU (regulator of sigma subunit)